MHFGSNTRKRTATLLVQTGLIQKEIWRIWELRHQASKNIFISLADMVANTAAVTAAVTVMKTVATLGKVTIAKEIATSRLTPTIKRSTTTDGTATVEETATMSVEKTTSI